MEVCRDLWVSTHASAFALLYMYPYRMRSFESIKRV